MQVQINNLILISYCNITWVIGSHNQVCWTMQRGALWIVELFCECILLVNTGLLILTEYQLCEVLDNVNILEHNIHFSPMGPTMGGDWHTHKLCTHRQTHTHMLHAHTHHTTTHTHNHTHMGNWVTHIQVWLNMQRGALSNCGALLSLFLPLTEDTHTRKYIW